MIETHFYRLYSYMTGPKIIESMTPYFVVVVSVLLPICCHIGSGMVYLSIFVEDVVAL